MDNWLYFVLGLIAWQLIKTVALAINQTIIEHRQKKFIKLVNIRFPERKDIALISVDSSDKRGMKKIERELREQYGLEEEDVEDLYRDR